MDESESRVLGDELGEINAEFESEAMGVSDTDPDTEGDACDEADELGLIVFVDVLESDEDVAADLVRVLVAIVDRVMTAVNERVADKRAVTVSLEVPDCDTDTRFENVGVIETIGEKVLTIVSVSECEVMGVADIVDVELTVLVLVSLDDAVTEPDGE